VAKVSARYDVTHHTLYLHCTSFGKPIT